MKLHDEVKTTKAKPNAEAPEEDVYEGEWGTIIATFPDDRYEVQFNGRKDPVVIEAEYLEITKKCDLCGGSLSRGHSEWGKKDEEPEFLCHTCCDERSLDFYREDKRLSSRLMMQAAVRRRDDVKIEDIDEKVLTYLEIIRASDRIQELAKRFEAEVWLPTLWPYYDAAETTAHSGETESFKVLMMSSAGRLMITIRAQDDKSEVTVITSDDGGSYMGIQSVYGTEEEATALLTAAIEGMPEMAPDSEVSIL